MNRSAFFDAVRRDPFGGRLSQAQVDGINGILDAFVSHGDGRAKTLAYALGTAFGESRCTPVREGFKKTDAAARRYVQANYGHKGKNWYCWPAGPYGHVYYGRGFPQLTWYENYVESSDDAGVDLAKYPDKMLDPVISARILIRGIVDGRWNAKGKGIAHYLTDTRDDVKNARRTVNVLDRWDKFADYYRSFLRAIEKAGGVPVAEPLRPDPADQVPEPRPKPKPTEPAYGEAPGDTPDWAPGGPPAPAERPEPEGVRQNGGELARPTAASSGGPWGFAVFLLLAGVGMAVFAYFKWDFNVIEFVKGFF